MTVSGRSRKLGAAILYFSRDIKDEPEIPVLEYASIPDFLPIASILT